nr:hypothetical protein [Tanacetum cinerariifolium]
MLIQQGEGSGTPTDPYHTPSQEAQPSSPTPIFTSSIPTVIPIPTVTQTELTPLRQCTRRARIAQSSALPPVADEPASPVRDVSEGEACPTDSDFIADQDRATIAKSSTLPDDTTPWGSMQHSINELMALCTSLQRQHSVLLVQFKAQEVEINKLKERVKVLEDNQGVIGARSTDDAPIKGRRIDEEEGITRRVNTDTEEIRMDEEEVAVERTIVPTASPIVATATVVTPYLRRKGKEVMVESDTPKKQRIHAEEELQGMIDSLDRTNESIAKYLQEYQDFAFELPLERRIELISDLVKYQDNYSKIYMFQSQQRRPWTKKQKKDYYMTVIKNNLGWKEEAERLKRKGFNLEQEKAKKQKTSEETQNYMHAPTEWKLYDLSGVHDVTAKVKEIFMLVEKDSPLRKEGASSLGRIVGNKMHKAFPLLVRKFPLSEGTSHCL